MKYQDLSKEQLIEFAKLRLAHDHKRIHFTKITFEEDWTQDIFSKMIYTEVDYGVSFIVKSKEWANFRLCIVFDKFYPDEFLFLQKCGIDF